MAEEANEGQNGQPEGAGAAPVQSDWEAKYKAAMAHSREWEKKAKANQGAADELEKLREGQQTELEKAQARAEAAENEAAQLKASQERAQAVAHVADAAKVPHEFVAMLSGKDADELAEQVERALKLLPAYPTRTDDGGTGGAAKKKDKADKFFDGLFGE
ncbi:MAG: hypothetical protein DBY20_03830 [Coriobacteriia bacterium]|nr:MAG: hypothetical protein DBY20_03830 [Coriobacteriia bacterium]